MTQFVVMHSLNQRYPEVQLSAHRDQNVLANLRTDLPTPKAGDRSLTFA